MVALRPQAAMGAQPCAVDRLAEAAGEQGRLSFERRYRANAVITLFSVPLFSRHNAGGGYAAIERAGGDRNATIALQFSAGTWPQQVHGLNRFGFQQEAVLEAGANATESAEFGFITSCPEGDFQQARNAFTANPGQLRCVTAHAFYTREGCSFSVDRKTLPSRYSWADSAELQRKLRSELPELNHPLHGGGQGIPFLYAVHKAILSPGDRFQTAFQHNGQCHLLETSKRPDRDTGKAFKARGIAADENSVVALNGVIRKPREDAPGSPAEKSAEFRLWFERGVAAGLPLRIELRPRSFLHLVFEQDSSAAGPPITHLISREES